MMLPAVCLLPLKLQLHALPGLPVNDPRVAALQVVLRQLAIVLHPLLQQWVQDVGLLKQDVALHQLIAQIVMHDCCCLAAQSRQTSTAGPAVDYLVQVLRVALSLSSNSKP